MAQCTAKSKRTGQQCRASAVKGRATCRMHGGTTAVGPASPTWKDGRHSSVLPKRLREHYEASLADPDRLVLEAEIALVDARISELLGVVDTRESGRIWSELQKRVTALEAGQAAKNPVAVATAQFEILMLIREGHAEWTAWNDVLSLIERRRKLVESERKRLVQQHQVVTADQAMALLALLVEAVHEHVHDRAVLRAITSEYTRLTGVEGPRPAGPPARRSTAD